MASTRPLREMVGQERLRVAYGNHLNDHMNLHVGEVRIHFDAAGVVEVVRS
jgi:hypothetical protein